jgi:hypothetical protein
LPTKDECIDDLLVISPHIGCLKKEEVIRGVIDARVTHLEARCGVERNIQAHGDVVDNGVLGNNALSRDTI